jgi:hypothetical protein
VGCSRWDIEISKLIANVNHAENITREYSLLRLLDLISINALTRQEQNNLASALWSKLDETTGLPLLESHCLIKSTLLYFPESEENRGNIVDLFRQHILSNELPSLSFDTRIAGDIISSLDLLLNSSFNLLLQSDCIVRNRIVWTTAEVNTLASRICQFTINSMEILKSQENNRFFFDDDLRTIRSRIVALLTLLIIPSWKNLDDKNKETTLDVSNEIIESWGLQSQILISLVQKENLKQERISEELKNKIYSSSLDLIEDGARGIFNWVLYYNSSIEVPEPPRQLIDSAISLFVSRRHPGFDLYLKLILSLITAIPDLLDINQLSQLLSGVEYILAETTLTKREKRDKYIIPNQKCRLYRGLAYEIAYQLDLIYSIRFPESYPSIIAQWKENSANEIWPEIKSLWKQN